MAAIARLRRRMGLTRGGPGGPVAPSGSAGAGIRPEGPDHPDLARAEALLAEGDGAGAVDHLVAAHRRAPDPVLEIALIDVRRRAAALLDVDPTGDGWPPRYDDPFPGLAGEIPVIDRDEVGVAVMAGAVAHHGALIVRNLFGPEEVTAVREVIDVAHEAHAAGDTTDVGVAYRPLTTGAPTRTAALRSMVADDGGIWLADSPRATSVAIDVLWRTGVVDVMNQHFGARPVFSLQKSTLRRSPPVRKIVGWHQDGSFYDPGVRTMNVWVALSPCGGDRPAAGLEIVPRRMEDILPVAGEPTKHSVSFEVVDRIAGETPTTVPTFDPGDAIVFDEHLLHRTHLPEGISDTRYALECWFFAPSRHSSRYVPLLV